MYRIFVLLIVLAMILSSCGYGVRVRGKRKTSEKSESGEVLIKKSEDFTEEPEAEEVIPGEEEYTEEETSGEEEYTEEESSGEETTEEYTEEESSGEETTEEYTEEESSEEDLSEY